MTGRATTGGKASKAGRHKTKSRRSSVVEHPVVAATDLQKQLDRRTRERDEAQRLLAEALEQQTATNEVLNVISSSPGELEPVFEAMLKNTLRICEAKFGQMFLCEGDRVRLVAHIGVPTALTSFDVGRGAFQPTAGGTLESVLRARQTIHVSDLLAEFPAYPPAKLGGARSYVAVPLLKDNALVGAIAIYRQEVKPFADKQIDLVKNFAAQAVIAIENTRLLNELRQRTDDLSESLQQQTATTEVLKVISSSPGELKPVFETILANAIKVCEAKFGTMFRYNGKALQLASQIGAPSPLIEYQRQRGSFLPAPGSLHDRAFRTRKVTHTADGLHEPTPGIAAKLGGARSTVVVPMVKDDELVGTMVIYRQEVRPFNDKQIELLKNFSNQAVIAIENARLLNELRESLQQQTATSDVLKVISRSAFDLKSVLQTLVDSAARLCRADRSSIRLLRDGRYHHLASHGYPAEHIAYMRNNPITPSRESVVGRVALESKVVHITDFQKEPGLTYLQAPGVEWVGAGIGVPLLREGKPIGTLLLMKTTIEPFTEKQIELATTFADQAVIAIENVRLFDEIQDKSRQLAEASQHKSQFLANMSHELRTPLNAILGYTELIADGVYGEPTEKMMGVLKRLESNGKHLLGLINDVLDLSKIEAGQLKLDLADYSIQDVAQTVYSAVEPLAADKKLAFKCEVDRNLPAGHGDGRRLTQVLLNLVGNAIKFTDSGEVVIKAEASNGTFNLSVRDTGPGISEADQAKLFQEFQQADNSITRKKGGTGLGLAISKRIVEMHGGRIWVESVVGHGSTFALTLPVRVEQQVTVD